MKITRVEQFIVAVPYISPIRKYRPTEHLDQPIAILRVHTDEGLIGLGEGGRGQRFDDQIPSWIGLDPLALKWTSLSGAWAMAIFDLVGQALRLPAHKLMGSQHWEKVPVSYWSCPMEPEEFAAEAEVGARLGFKSHKIKARPWNVVETVKQMAAAAGPDYAITVDPNFTFESLGQTARLARQLEGYNIQAFEDPFPYQPGWHDYRLLRQKIEFPVAPHLYDPKMILSALRAEAADLFNTGGSVAQTLQNAGLAEAAGLPVWLQVVALGLGISGAYGTHVHAVVRNATIPSDSLHFLRENDLIGGALRPRDGFVEVPTAPGLGVELDLDAVEHYRVG